MRDQLQKKFATSTRLVSRAEDERAVLVQFINVEAPEAVDVQRLFAALRHEFGDRITFAARHLPTTETQRIASAALEAAGRQDRFDDFLDTLLTSTEQSSRFGGDRSQSEVAEELQRVAAELDMDLHQFVRDMEDPLTADALIEDRKDAEAMGITRAPSFLLLDGRDHDAFTSREDFYAAVTAAAK